MPPIGATGVDLGQSNLMPLLFDSCVSNPQSVAMYRELALKHLTQSEAACAEGRRHIAAQESRIERLRADGHDVAEADWLLHLFFELQRQHEMHRDRLLVELAEMNQVQSLARAG